MKARSHIFLIHGGETFRNRKDYLRYLKTRTVSLEKRKSWSGEYLDKKLGKKFEIIRPQMPLKEHAQYEDWKIHFERFFPALRQDLILIGNSLGGIFLAKYLSENKPPKRLKAVYLICPPFDDSLPGEDLVGGFTLKSDLSQLEKSTKNLFLMFSEDDDVVPPVHAEKYRKKLPTATIKIYKGKNGHFFVPTFPELVRSIESL